VEGVHAVNRIHLAGACVVLCLLGVNCGGGKSTTTTTTSGQGVQINVPTSSPEIDAGQSVNITANQSVLWSLQAAPGIPIGCLGSSNPCVQSTATPSPTITYMAPASVGAATAVTVVATSPADSTQSAGIGVLVNPPVSLDRTTAITRNQDCSYSPLLENNNGNAGALYSTQGAGQGLLAVSNSGTGTAPFTWSIASGSLPVGMSLDPIPHGLTCQSPGCVGLGGTPVSAGCSQFQLQVTDATGETATSPTYNLVITPAALKIQVPNYPIAYAGVPYPPTAFSVSSTPTSVPPYVWTVNPNNPLPANMSLNLQAGNTGVAFITGVPATAPTSTPLLVVTDSQTPYPAIGQVELGFTGNQGLTGPQPACTPQFAGSFNNADMLGSYAFLLRGFDANGPVVIAGSFTADGAGNVQGGVEDVLRTTVAGSQAGVTVSGSYSVFEQQSVNYTFNEIACVTLTDSGGTTSTFAFTLGGCSTSPNPNSGACVADSQGAAGVYTTGRMIEFDNTGTQVSGILRLQDASALSAGLSGPYAFGLSGWDPVGNTRIAAAGSVTASSGTFSSVAADVNDGGSLQSALTGGSGSYSLDPTAAGAQPTGRGTATLSVGSGNLNLAFYVVSAQEVMLVSTGTPSAANPIISGEAISASGPFSTASLQNSHIFHSIGMASLGPDANIGVLTFDGVGAVTGTQYEDRAGAIGTTSLSGGYSVDSTTGRVAFVASSTNSQSLGDHPFVAYVVPVPNTLARQNCAKLSRCVTGFLLSTDVTAQAGQLEFQTPSIAPPPPFSILYVQGYYFYGTDESLDGATPFINGTSNASPNGPVYAGVQSTSYSSTSFYCQQAPGCSLLLPNESISSSGTYSVSSNGTGTIGGETVAVTNGNVIFYIDESPINTHPSVVIAEQ